MCGCGKLAKAGNRFICGHNHGTAMLSEKHCETCGKVFSVRFSRRDKAKFCSYNCYWKFMKGNKLSEQCKLKISVALKGVKKEGHPAWNKGKKYSKSVRKKMSEARKGRHFSPFSKKHKEKISKALMNNKNGWIHGLAYEPYSVEFNKELKELIRHRDNYKCQLCDVPELGKNRKLSIHHIDYNKMNSMPSNLITLCNSCNTKVNYCRKQWTKYFQNKIKILMNSKLILHRKNQVSVNCI